MIYYGYGVSLPYLHKQEHPTPAIPKTGFLFLSDLKDDLNDGTLLRSAAAVLRTILKKLSGTDLDALYTHVLRRFIIATYSKRLVGAVPKYFSSVVVAVGLVSIGNSPCLPF